MERMKLILKKVVLAFVSLCLTFFVGFSHRSSIVASSNKMSLQEVKDELSKSNLWIAYGIERTIYCCSIDGSEEGIVCDNIGSEGYDIIFIDSSMDGKTLVVTMKKSSMGNKHKYTVLLIDLTKNIQISILRNTDKHIGYLEVSDCGKYVIFGQNDKVYFYNVFGHKLSELGVKVSGITYRSPSLSHDNKYVVYTCSSGDIWQYDIENNVDNVVTMSEDSDFWNPHFTPNNDSLICARKTDEEKDYSLWRLNIVTKGLTKLASIDGDSIWSGDEAKNTKAILFSTGDDFYFIKDKKVHLLLDSKSSAGWHNMVLDNSGYYALLSNGSTPIHIAKTDGSFCVNLYLINNKLSIPDSSWYIAPPFPTKVSVVQKNSGNLIHWGPSKKGSNDVVGYNVYRKNFGVNDDYKMIHTTANNTFEFLDTVDIKSSCYYIVKAIDSYKIESAMSNEFLVDKQSPKLVFLSPEPELWLNKNTILVEGYAEDPESKLDAVLLNGHSVEYDENGYFELEIELEKENKNVIQGTASDETGNKTEALINVYRDTTPPVIVIDFPHNGSDLYTLDTYARGNVQELGSGLRDFFFNDRKVEIDAGGVFNIPLQIEEGLNTFSFAAIDNVGNKSSVKLSIFGVQKIVVRLTIGSNKIIVNDKEEIIDAPPFIDQESNRTLIPARFIVEPIGGSITFNQEEQKVTIERKENCIELWIGKSIAVVNGEEVKIDPQSSLSPMIRYGRTFLPLRFVSENIGFKVDWDPVEHQIIMQYPKTMD
jgi:hypothetical protein